MGGFECTIDIGQETMEARVRRMVLTVVVWDGEVYVSAHVMHNGFAVLLILRSRSLSYTVMERRDHKL